MNAPRNPLARAVVQIPAYSVPRATVPTDLRLDANEGATPSADLLAAAGLPAAWRRYPSTAELEGDLAARFGLDPTQVLITAGADDALDRVCRSVLRPGDNAVFPEPGFVVMRRWIELADATVTSVPWPDGPYPTDAVLAAVDDRTRLVVVTSPNNPTGGVIDADGLRRIAHALPDRLVLLDCAYAEFADQDLTQVGLELPNVVVIRTFSKAWGLAALRVGWAMGRPEVIGWLRSAGLPYPAAGPSLAMARAALGDPQRVDRFVARVRKERDRLVSALDAAGARPQRSQANFVLARVDDPITWRDRFAELGIAIRAFPGAPGLEDAVRIACPGDPASFDRLLDAMQTLFETETDR